MEVFFWICLAAIAYPYAIYPVLLVLVNRVAGRQLQAREAAVCPSVSVVLPVHNEARRIEEKLRNLIGLDYPADRLHIIVVGDGCTDDTLERAARVDPRIETTALPARAGKAAALNAGVERSTADIVVFTDAAIVLEPRSLRALVAHFANPIVGCVSGEDRIEGAATEGLYGRLELLLRREEARLHSIAGASGCFYGIRRSLCRPFRSGMAPDFLSVLETVQAGHRAVCEPAASGTMASTNSQRAEFERKTRTFLRGLTALFGNAVLLNPFKYPAFAFILWSHKLMRWLVPLFMAGALISSALLAGQQPLYAGLAVLQILCYALALLGLWLPQVASRVQLARISAFFLMVNAAAALALFRWLSGVRQETWEPTQRP